MAWAAGRTTTRAEDIAYCLLGIFDVNMPMLYGEGKRAFLRLQEEIMRESNDTSLFAWKAKQGTQQFRGILAESPAEFADAGGIDLGNDMKFDTEFSITNKGIRIHTNVWNANGKPIFPLKCRLGGKAMAIHLHQHGAGVYARSKPDSLLVEPDDEKDWKSQGTTLWAQMSPLYINKVVPPNLAVSLFAAHKGGIHLRKGFTFSSDLSAAASKPGMRQEGRINVTWTHPGDQWDSERELFLTGNGGDFTAITTTYGPGLETAMLLVGIKDGRAWANWLDLVQHSDAGSKIMDLEYLGRIGPNLGASEYKGLHLQVVQDVVDGETVFCVDMTKRSPPQDGLAGRMGAMGGLGGRSRRLSG